MITQPLYRHEPLPPHTIRLLTLHPSSDPSENIKCTLTSYSLSSTSTPTSQLPPIPPYEALSYTWGTDSPNTQLTINSYPFPCRSNLHAALHTLRKYDAQRILWVDAICINQADTKERNHQVRLMREIYRRANVVDVWLGFPATTPSSSSKFSSTSLDSPATAPSTEEKDRKGIQFLKLMNESLTKIHRERGTRPMRIGSTWGRGGKTSESVVARGERTYQWFQDYYAPILLFLEDGHTENLNAAVALLRRPWWSRMWTLQESVLGSRVDVYCGGEVIPLSYFFELSYFVFLALNFSVWPGAQVEADVNVRAAWSMADLRDHVAHRGAVGILLALDASWQRKAADARDKVYGIMGLIGDDALGLEADYDAPVEEVYTSVFAAIVRKKRSFSFLGFISEEMEKRNRELPSWVPDLELHSNEESDYTSSLSKPRFYGQVYNASGVGFDNGHCPTVDGAVLTTGGVVVDKVETIGSKTPGRVLTNKKEEIDGWITEMHEVLSQWRSLYSKDWYEHSSEPANQAFWRCVLVDLRQGHIHPSYDPGRPTRLNYRERKQLGDQLDVEEQRQDLLLFWSRFCRLEFRQLRMIEQFNRRFFITADGFIGLGPPSLRRGDSVCLLRGGLVMYALRPLSNGHWKYIGECYVHGIMDGELLEQVGEGKHRFTEFQVE